MSTQTKSIVHRFPILSTRFDQWPVHNVQEPNANRVKATSSFNYKVGDRNNPKAAKLPRFVEHGPSSSGLAAVREGWFFRSGCCASIRQASNSPRILYYIPDVGPMSLKKKIAYIREIEKLFPKNIKYLKTVNGPALEHPLVKGFGKKRITINPDNQGVISTPGSLAPAKRFLVVYGHAKYEFDRLLYLQFLRPLYQTVQVQYPLEPEVPNSYRILDMEYYQPRLFFRLKELFPDMKPMVMFYLSFVIHGVDISSTFFPYYSWLLKPRIAKPTATQLTEYESILSLLHVNGGTMEVVNMPTAPMPFATAHERIYTPVVFKEIDPGTKYDMNAGRIPHPAQAVRKYLTTIFPHNTRESYTAAIKLIAEMTGNKYLNDYINPTK